MKILLVTLGSYGDVHPFVGLGMNLKSRGHDVTLIANGNFEHLAIGANLGFIPLGTAEEYKTLAANPDLWHPRKGTQVVMSAVLDTLKDVYPKIVDNYVPGETVVVASSLCLAARVAQDKLKIPTVTVHLQPVIFRSVIEPPKLPGLPTWKSPAFQKSLWWVADKFLIDPSICPRFNAFRAELGLPPVSRIMKDYWHSPQRVIGFFPEWYAPMQTDWPAQTRLVGFPLFDEKGITALPTELENFLKSGEKPIVFTPGSAMFHGEDFFSEAAKACVAIGRRGILLTRYPDQIPKNLPDSVRHFDYAPFSELLPHSAALVHHGGIGTTAQALRAACPQLLMPMSHDQFDNAQRIEKLGVGESIARSKFRGKKLREKLSDVLHKPRRSENCLSVAARFEGVDALTNASTLIEEVGNSPR